MEPKPSATISILLALGFALAALGGAARPARAQTASILACQTNFVEQSRSLTDTINTRLEECVVALLTCEVEAEQDNPPPCSIGNPVPTCNAALDAIDQAAAQRTQTLRQACQSAPIAVLRGELGGLAFGDLDAACAVDGPEPETLELLLGCHDRLLRRRAEGLVGRLLPRACELLASVGLVTRAPGVCLDGTGPIVSVDSPSDGSTLDTRSVSIAVSYLPVAAELDLSSLALELDGVDVTGNASITPAGATLPARELRAGSHTMVARISDQAGKVGTAQSTFVITIFRAIADCSPTKGPRRLEVLFRDRGEFTAGTIVQYRWDFQNDGQFDRSEQVPIDRSFTYAAKGIYTAVLEVTSNLGKTATDTCTIEVTGNKPTVRASANPSNGPIPLNATLSCSASDLDGPIALYEWDFESDGTYDASNVSGSAQHTYSTVGTFVATCRATDSDGEKGTASTVLRTGPAGTVRVFPSGGPTNGIAPQLVNLVGSATSTSGGQITLWEWDFDGDGTFDYSSATSATTNFTYRSGGRFTARLRATDSNGKTGLGTMDILIEVDATLVISDDTFDPSKAETARIDTSLSGTVPVRLFIQNAQGAIVRELVNATRAPGSYFDIWDGRDGTGSLVGQGKYFAILEHTIAGEVRRLDLTDTTGGDLYNPDRERLCGGTLGSCPRVLRPLGGDAFAIDFTIPPDRGASEVTAFIGLVNTDSRMVTLLDREPLGVGTHALRWDGIDGFGNVTVAPPGDDLLFAVLAHTLSDNTIFVESAPVLSEVSVSPLLFDPSTQDFSRSARPRVTVSYTLDRPATVELTITGVPNRRVFRRIVQANEPPATGKTIRWDGKTADGVLVDRGDYQLSLRAVDAFGVASLERGALVRVSY